MKQFFKRTWIHAFALGMLLALLLVPVHAESSYSDTAGHWAESAIERWSEYGVIEGKNGTFDPDASITRAEMAKILSNLLGLTEAGEENPFSDVPDGMWYTPYMLRCYEEGILNGSDDGKANPEASITRQEAMVMICRALSIEPLNHADLSAYVDSAAVADWAHGSVAALTTKGIVNGVSENTLAPEESISRAAVVTILDKAIAQYFNEPGTFELNAAKSIILVASGDVELTGATDASLAISSAAAGRTVAFTNATVWGTVTVQAENCALMCQNTKLSKVIRLRVEPLPIHLAYEAVEGNPTAVIEPQLVDDGNYYLFLPSSADYTKLRLLADDGTVFTGTTDTQLEADGATLDLTMLFGEMEPGEKYALTATCAEKNCQITLMKSANIPSMHITLDESELPSGYETALSYIHADKSNKLSGNLVMIGSGGDALEETLKQLKGRGNATWIFSGEKRPYNIKLGNKQELIYGAGKAKNWCLLSNNQGERSGISNAIAYMTYENMGGNAALSTQSVDLYINSEYRGTYFLTEKVEINESRVDIAEPVNQTTDNALDRVNQNNTNDPAIKAGVREYQYVRDAVQEKEGGFLLELDFHYLEEASWFVTRRGVQIVIKEPEYATKEQVQRIAVYVQEFEDALFSTTGYNEKGIYYKDYIDLNSFADLYALDCYTSQLDMMLTSSFYYIDANIEGNFITPLISGPAWDYDNLFSTYHEFFPYRIIEQYSTTTAWAPQLLKHGDFTKILNYENSVLRNSFSTIHTADIQAYSNTVTSSQTMNDMLYHNAFPDYAAYYKEAYADRFDYWYDTIWADTNLLGVTASNNDGVLAADVSGTAATYQWYRIDPDDKTISAPIEGATESTFTPDESGIYYVAVTGGNISYSQYAADNPEMYTMDGVLALVALPEITMYSNPVILSIP